MFYREFGGDGKCTKIPYSEKISTATTATSYHIHEYYGMILVWHTNETVKGTTTKNDVPTTTCAVAKQEQAKTLPKHDNDLTILTNAKNSIPKPLDIPLYFPPELPHLGDTGDMVFRGTRSMCVNMNIREFCENSTDFAVSD